MTPFSAITALLAFVACVAAKDIWIQVGANKTNDATTVFQPQRVTAKLGDTVMFNFTNGNHSATQSTFSAPCIPAHDSNITINGFDSMFRDAGNGTAVTILAVPMLPENVNKTMWFYDRNTCGAGGVGVINNDENTTETLDGFERNAVRLNGTASSSSSVLHSSTGTPTSGSTASTETSNEARHLIVSTMTFLVPLLGVAMFA
ncbi:hypothetical protein EYR38_007089 [Pleurotus pulmonarius]|nr:hypothetical protein EYR38_007089 [Pleurotus pulmonarius]